MKCWEVRLLIRYFHNSPCRQFALMMDGSRTVRQLPLDSRPGLCLAEMGRRA